MTTVPVNPTPGGQRPMGAPQQPDNKDQTKNIIMIALIVLFLATTGFFAAKYFSEKGKTEQQTVEMDSLNTEISDLETKIKGLETDIESKNTEISEKDRLLEERLKELEGLNARIAGAQKSGRISESKAKELQAKISELENMLTAYKEEISRLKEENKQLSGQVSTLTEESALQKQEVEDLKKQKTETEAVVTAKEEVIKQKEEAFEQKNKELEDTKQAGSVLRAADFRFFNVKKNDKEKEEVDKEFKRMWMQNVRVCCKIMDNAIAKAGPREIYFVYENPDKSTRYTTKSGKFKFDNRDISYTTKETVVYNKVATEVCTMIPKPDNDDKFQKGMQTVSVYCEGKLIGKGTFEIK